METGLEQIIPPVELIHAIRQQYQLTWDGVHGVGHWARVLENGWRLAESTDANREVIALFSVLHDACRRNEDHDPEHGRRGASLAATLRHHFPRIDDRDFAILQTACTHHTTGRNHPDITVQTCWDADRLDLMRVGIEPTPLYLCTLAAKQTAMIKWAIERNLSDYQPKFACVEWACGTLNTSP